MRLSLEELKEIVKLTQVGCKPPQIVSSSINIPSITIRVRTDKDGNLEVPFSIEELRIVSVGIYSTETGIKVWVVKE